MNKFATVIMAAAAAALLVTACSKSDDTAEEQSTGTGIKVGFSQVGAESDWRKASTESI